MICVDELISVDCIFFCVRQNHSHYIFRKIPIVTKLLEGYPLLVVVYIFGLKDLRTITCRKYKFSS